MIGIRSGGKSYEMEPLSCGVCPNSGWLLCIRTEWNCRTRIDIQSVGGLVGVREKAYMYLVSEVLGVKPVHKGERGVFLPPPVFHAHERIWVEGELFSLWLWIRHS